MLFYVLYNVVYTFSCYASGWLADRFPKYAVLAVGYSLAVIPAVALGAAWHVAQPSSPSCSSCRAFTWACGRRWKTATAAELLPAQSRGIGFGVLATVNGVGDFLSSAAGRAAVALSPVAR